MQPDENYKKFATATQWKYYVAYCELGKQGAVADLFGVREHTVNGVINDMKRKAARYGYAPDYDLTHPSSDSHYVKGTSTLYDEDGKVRLQWVKTDAEKRGVDDLIDLFKGAVEDYRGIAKPVKGPARANGDILVVLPMGDPHIGMYAWSDETGDDFDADIAERNLTEAVSKLVKVTPPAETCLILNLGDFFHADNSLNQTLRSNNPLDVDSRWGRVFKIGLKAMIQCVDEARRRHDKVIVKNLIGNHDDHTSQALAYALDAYFHNDERVEVDISPAKFWYYQFHNVLIGAGHGDTCKPDQLPGIMAADVPEKWGATQFRYWYTGHIHSQNMKEYPGVIWESFKTLAGKDAWHAAKGYRSGRDMYAIVHHKDYGEVERHRVDVSMLRGKSA